MFKMSSYILDYPLTAFFVVT